MRVALATILLVEPDILFLDEPTNHLDLEATLWLESFLAEWKGGLIMISHDRAFLDKAVNNIIEIERKKVTLYHGNYSAYREAKVLRQEQHRAAYLNQQKQIAEKEKFIDRFRYKSTKARQVQSRIKMLEKLDRIEAPDESANSMHVKIPQPDRPPLKIGALRNVSKRYGDLSVFGDLDLVVERDQKIGLVGYNGAGKSTLLKMMAGVEPVSGGTVIISSKVKVAYFAQHQLETLDLDKTVYETIQSISPGWKISGIRAYLGSFMFSGEAVEKKVKVLSGGEKSRLALARMLVEPAHLLLLDEPTNHLDMISRNVVETAMKSFTGSIVCISHDRHFLNSVTNLTCEVGGGNIRMFNGNYDYYTWKKSVAEEVEAVEQKTMVGASKKLGYREQKRLKNRLSRIRNRLNDLDKSLDHAREEVNNPNHASDYEHIRKTLNSMTEMENEYLELMEEQESVEL